MGAAVCSQQIQVGLMMRPGNGFGSAERLVEGLAGRRSVDSIATGRRSHSQEQSTPRHRSPSRRGHKIPGVYHLIPFHIHQVNGVSTQVKSCSGDGIIRMQEVRPGVGSCRISHDQGTTIDLRLGHAWKRIHLTTPERASPMTETTSPIPVTLASPVDQVFPTLTPAQIARLAAHGHVRPGAAW